MANATNLCAVHRFGDELAISACDHEAGATVYLSLQQAKAIRAAMGRLIRSIERHGFANSPAGLGHSVTVRDRRFSAAPVITRAARNA